MKKPINVKVTKEGFEALKIEQEHLTKLRPEVLKRMVEAREQGDLSENAGYHASREQLSQIDGRQREIKLLLRFAEVIDKTDNLTISMGNRVKLENDGRLVEFKIVSATEADPSKNKLSDVSPLGSLLLGKKVGEVITLELPTGKVNYLIVSVA